MRTRTTGWLVAGALVLLACAGWQGAELRRQRGGAVPEAALEDAPPLLAFSTVALGGFRGLLADVLWLRATYLQERGDYFEMVQLADWIAALEPHDADVWAFHAWNMAYNISAAMSRPEDRWRWVENGIRLLRDEGIPANPTSRRLYIELGWLFQHKIGTAADEAHAYYKTRWLSEMHRLLGGPSPGRAGEDSELARRLRREYRMDVAVMRKLDVEFGPLDWRLPQAHAIYWAYLGRSADHGGMPLTCDRMIFQSLGVLFRSGSLIVRPETHTFQGAPNPALFDQVCRAYESALLRHRNDETVQSSYALFLRDAVRVLHRLGQDDRARAAFERLQAEFPGDRAVADGFDALASSEEGRG